MFIQVFISSKVHLTQVTPESTTVKVYSLNMSDKITLQNKDLSTFHASEVVLPFFSMTTFYMVCKSDFGLSTVLTLVTGMPSDIKMHHACVTS